MARKNTLYWHDYETFGATPKTDRPSQFAGIRTDEDLNIIGEPLMVYCKPANDFLPHPMACKVTGVTPKDALEKGIPEHEFIDLINKELGQAGTCGTGYNSIAFDDEVTRYTLYRNLHDPYAREWQNGCSRWDIMNMIRLVAIKAPDTLNWPINDKGFKSFRLEELSVENGIIHENAHDALSDVIATIDIAKLIKNRVPKLYNYVYELRNKNKVLEVLSGNDLVIHVDSFYGGDKNYFTITHPICAGKNYTTLNNNDYILIDVTRPDFQEWVNLPLENLKNQLFSTKDELEEKGLVRPGVNKIAINKCPVVSTHRVLSDTQLNDFNIDINTCIENLNYLKSNPDIANKLSQLFVSEMPVETDPDSSLYGGGFTSKNDRQSLDSIRHHKDFNTSYNFEDNKFYELVFRYKARNFDNLLTDVESQKWEAFRLDRIKNGGSFSIDEFCSSCIEMLTEFPESKSLVVDIIEYGKSIGDSEIIEKLTELESKL